jgi:hypothetical protein
MTHLLNLAKERSLTVLYEIHHHPLLALHLSVLLYGLLHIRNLRSTLYYALLRALSINLPLLLVHVFPKTTTLLNIWLKHRVLCLH